ncbi:branched-subunit amino acid transport protein AzlD [Motilibacter rhizosphaerae]|uniref:Branched-subunit amino acid transport protein AzlD n=1 Tax=Motilibacter rhizosphaerae TaxID=598652 RepID=A0A4Q7NBE6_9ACTN|nr:AzlD domain-containing protein [Motilibacter rhizosphaerae]RZS80150.1 branched-subunit amino acid transport protein AzlD [Motilibacter rhizosphaerae]
MSWTFVLVLAAGVYLPKLLGHLVPEQVLEAPVVQRFAAVAPAGLLAALVLTQTFVSGTSYVLEPRAAGLGVALAAVALRAPFLVVVMSAVLTAAVVHAL